jgi:hypothetical protein
VRSEKKLKVNSALLAKSGGVGSYDHSLCNRHYASCGETSLLFDLNEAKTASADLLNVLEVAKSGNVDVSSSCCFENGGAFRNRNGNSVDS